jgi:hypothetical protein
MSLLVFTLMVSACSQPESRQNAVPVYPVEGKLFVGGKPAAGAVVMFHSGGDGPKHSTKVRDDGRFVPTQTDGAVGLPEGSYSLTVTWQENEKDRFQGKYADPAKPAAKLTVRSGVNLIPPIRLP